MATMFRQLILLPVMMILYTYVDRELRKTFIDFWVNRSRFYWDLQLRRKLDDLNNRIQRNYQAISSIMYFCISEEKKAG